MWGPFCSVPPVGIITVVLPAAIPSRSSTQVSSSRNTLFGLGSDGALGAWAPAGVASHRSDANASAGENRIQPPEGEVWVRALEAMDGSLPQTGTDMYNPGAERSQAMQPMTRRQF